MRLDHIAFRVLDRRKAAQFYMDAFGYKIQTEFDVPFDDGTKAKCIALEPPEKVSECPWTKEGNRAIYHLPPEIFISDGDENSIVGKWVAQHGPGIHHMAYQVDSVEKKVQEWREKGYAEFSSEDVIKCPGLTQIFTKPSEMMGVVYEFIERGAHGFCQENVAKLMISSKTD